MVGAGPCALPRAAEERLLLRRRRPPVIVAHLDLGHLDGIVFTLLVIHLEGWCGVCYQGLCRTRKCHKGENWRERWDCRRRRIRGKCRAVSIAASVGVSRTVEMSGGGFGVLEKRLRLLNGIKYLASPYEILAVVNFRLDGRGMTQDVNEIWRIRDSSNFYSQDEQNSTNTKKVGMNHFFEMQ